MKYSPPIKTDSVKYLNKGHCTSSYFNMEGGIRLTWKRNQLIVFVHSDMCTNSVANNIQYVCPQSDKDVTLGKNDGVHGFGQAVFKWTILAHCGQILVELSRRDPHISYFTTKVFLSYIQLCPLNWVLTSNYNDLDICNVWPISLSFSPNFFWLIKIMWHLILQKH